MGGFAITERAAGNAGDLTGNHSDNDIFIMKVKTP
jgi:hypothetical protein